MNQKEKDESKSRAIKNRDALIQTLQKYNFEAQGSAGEYFSKELKATMSVVEELEIRIEVQECPQAVKKIMETLRKYDFEGQVWQGSFSKELNAVGIFSYDSMSIHFQTCKHDWVVSEIPDGMLDETERTSKTFPRLVHFCPLCAVSTRLNN